MAQDLGGIVGIALGGNTRGAQQRVGNLLGGLVQDALTPDTVASELDDEREEQRENRKDTLSKREMEGLLEVAKRTDASVDIRPMQDGTYRFTINGDQTTSPLRVAPEAIELAQQSPLVRMAQAQAPARQTDVGQLNIAPEADTQSRSTQQGVTSVFLNMVTLQEEGLAKATQNAQYLINDVRNLVGSDERVEITERLRIGTSGKYIDIPPGNYTAETLMRTMGDQIALSNELRAYTREAANPTPVVNEPGPAAPASSVATPPTPRLEVDPTVFEGNDGVTGGTPSATTQASTSKAPAPTIAATMDGPSAPPPIDSALAGSPEYQQTVANRPAAPAPTAATAPMDGPSAPPPIDSDLAGSPEYQQTVANKPASPAPAASTALSQQQLMEMGKEVTAEINKDGKNAKAIEALLGKSADGNGQLSDKEATAALNKMQLLNFSPEGRAQLAELAKALKDSGVSDPAPAQGEQTARPVQVASLNQSHANGISF